MAAARILFIMKGLLAVAHTEFCFPLLGQAKAVAWIRAE
jgi:hypothetical protein